MHTLYPEALWVKYEPDWARWRKDNYAPEKWSRTDKMITTGRLQRWSFLFTYNVLIFFKNDTYSTCERVIFLRRIMTGVTPVIILCGATFFTQAIMISWGFFCVFFFLIEIPFYPRLWLSDFVRFLGMWVFWVHFFPKLT